MLQEMNVEYTFDEKEAQARGFMHLHYEAQNISSLQFPNRICRFIYVRCVNDLLILINNWNRQSFWKFWYEGRH
jgi:hypothetical protein